MLNQPNLLLLAGFAFGLYAAGGETAFYVLAPAGLLWAALAYIGKWREALLIAGAAVCAFFYWGTRTPEVPDLMLTPKTMELAGEVADHPVMKIDKTSFYLNSDCDRPDLKRIRVVVRSEVKVRKGDVVIARGRLEIPREPGNPGEFDYKKYLERRQVYYIFTVKKLDHIKVIGDRRSMLEDLILASRERGEEALKRFLPRGTAEVAKGIVLGAADEINPEDYRDFQKTGLAHVLAASGMNIGFVMLMGVWAADALKLGRRYRGLLAALLILFYGSTAGWPVSLLRAAVMAWLGLAAYYGGREPNAPNALAVSGLVMLIWNPVWVFDLSFQLSFLATAGLIWLYPAWRQAVPYKSKLVDAFLIPLAAQAATLPLIVGSFSLFSLSSVIANFAAAYLCGVALILSLAGFFAGTVIPFSAALFLYPAGLAVDGITWVSKSLSSITGSYLWVAPPPLWFILAFYLGLVASARGLRCRDRRMLVGGLLLIGVYLGCLVMPAGMKDRGWMEVTFLDVGQGDAVLVKSPQGRFMMIDCGGSQFWDVGQQTVVPAMARRGLRELDILVITHPDLDHIGGAPAVIKEMAPRVLAVSASAYPGTGFQETEAARLKHAIPVVELAKGQYIRLDPKLSINVLHPEPQGNRAPYNRGISNEESVVLRLQYGNISFLLPGDIDARTMDMLARENLLSETTVVKVPHHGSKGSVSERFYQAVRPKIAVISVGKNNIFGHPAPQTLELLNRFGIKTYRTDLDGAIIFKTDGKRLLVKTVRKRAVSTSLRVSSHWA